LSDPDYTYDWASSHFASWSRLFAPVQDSTRTILEIGSFEGRSAAFFLSFFEKATIVCIDTFEGSAEHVGADARFPADMEAVEKRFDSNLAPFGDRVRKVKGPSLVMLDQLNPLGERFDLIYVDGDHAAASVFADAALAWRLLRPGGILVIDDYGWRPESASERRPGPGIDAFLNLVRGEFEELGRGYQVIVRKVDAPAVAHPLEAERPVYLPAPGLTPPLVSFVVISWNYARYVGDAIRSIRNQDYPHFECIVVDNASTDDSRTAIEASIAGDDRFTSVYLEENLGQLGAAMWVLDRLKGSYVTFVDSDDVIFTNFASMHLQAHLGFASPVAVTTSAVAETNASGQVIQFCDYRAKVNAATKEKGLRPLDDVVRLPGVSDSEYRYLSAASATTAPDTGGWIWSPGTANMFRRSVLDLSRMGDGTRKLMRPADGHFNRVCHALGGTGIINLVLSAYRIHGRNAFASHEALKGINRANSDLSWDSKDDTVETIRHLLEKKRFYAAKVGKRYLDILFYFLRSLGNVAHEARTKSLLAEHIGEMQEMFGERDTNKTIVSWYGTLDGLQILRNAKALRLGSLRHRLLSTRARHALLRRAIQ
jgi:glycosyltransferase involved in cell wall biosynthesis/predicted O-methyltransferase YrrM